MRDVVIVGAARTAIGSFMGSLAPVPAPKLGATAIKAALERASVAASDVGLVHMGMVLPAAVGQAPARQAALFAGLPPAVPCVTVNKVCGSGLEAVLGVARAIAAGEIEIGVAGGMESMSNAPHAMHVRSGVKMGPVETIDTMVVDGLWDPYSNQHMGNCAELCAKEKGIPRSAQDEHAAESYRRALDAQKQGHFKAEIVAVKIADKKQGEISVDTDEEPGRGNIQKLASLRPAFQKDGTVTPGNASSINDGAAAVVLMSADEAKKRGAKTLAKLVSWGYHAQAPEWFTTAPAVAIQNALRKVGWDANKVDLWEINEAFSVVSVANNQLLGLDAAKVNLWGGAVALGHPIGASGCRILVTLLHAMAAKNVKTGCASLCIGGGEGIALLVERP